MRPLELDDLFGLEQIGIYFGGPYDLSPDGTRLAYVVQRPKATATTHKQDFLCGNDRADVWMVRLNDGSEAMNLTHGLDEGIGYWAPSWSPDGSRLAMLSTRGDNLTLCVWDGEELRQLTTRGVSIPDIPYRRPYQWLSPEEVLCVLLPEGEQDDVMTIEMKAARKAMEVWPRAWRGREVTASVLESGVRPDLSRRPQPELVRIDITSGDTRTLATGFIQDVALAPGHGVIAYLQATDVYRPTASLPLEFGVRYRFGLEVLSLDGDPAPRRPAPDLEALPESLRWNRDGTRLAFVGRGPDREARAYVCGPRDGTPHAYGGRSYDPAPGLRASPELVWTGDGRLLVLAGRRDSGDDRKDWWLLGPDGVETALTEGLDEAPPALHPELGARSFAGVAGGRLWRVRTDGAPEELCEARALAWPSPRGSSDAMPDPDGLEISEVVAEVGEGPSPRYRLVELPSASTTDLAKPTDEARLVGYDPVKRLVIFSCADRTGTYIWTGEPGRGSFTRILETNTFLREVEEGGFRRIEYRSLDGEELGAWLILPPGHCEGTPYPLITWIYPGLVWGPNPPGFNRINNPHALNLQIPAARGYAVLLPSIPLRPEGETDDPLLELSGAMMPAVELAVEMGIADPERLYLMGQSYGGYGVYGLVGQTSRFRAAVALAGLADLISLVGNFDPRLRYDDHPHEDLFQPALMESAQGRMGGPFWKDLGRYLRNSPIFYVDRVETPLMIAQGDMDYIPMAQGEEFFWALYRQGKRAEFVRYWGEGHVLEGPANIEDMWARVFDWFEQFDPGREE